MNQAIQAIRKIDETDAEHERKLAVASAVRRSLPTAKNAEYSTNFSHAIKERNGEIERLSDERTVALADIDLTIGQKIDAEAHIRDSLMDQLEQSRLRLARLETEKTRSLTETREHYANEIAEARKTIAAFEAAASVLAKPVE